MSHQTSQPDVLFLLKRLKIRKASSLALGAVKRTIFPREERNQFASPAWNVIGTSIIDGTRLFGDDDECSLSLFLVLSTHPRGERSLASLLLKEKSDKSLLFSDLLEASATHSPLRLKLKELLVSLFSRVYVCTSAASSLS